MTRAAIAAGVVALLIAGAYWLGLDHAKTRREAQDWNDYIGGAQDAQDAQSGVPAGPDARRDWLRRYPE